MSELALLSAGSARALTDEVKRDARSLWQKLLTLYERQAHAALGYSSWADYYAEEFGRSDADAYRILQAARVMRELPMGSPAPATERVARELTPLANEPERVREAWSETVERHGPTPTAAQTAEVVVERTAGQLSNQTGGSDEWATPQPLFDALDREFGFDLDVCALDSSAKCARYFTPQTDGLAQEWSGTCWMNPPYGREIVAWIRKASLSADGGATVVCLVPARVDTGWWWDYCRFAEVRFLRGRFRFGDAQAGAPFPSALVVFGRPAAVKWWEWDVPVELAA